MADRSDASSFLGRGFKFPVQADPVTGRMMTSAYEDDIQEAIYIILMTRKGERVRNPEFGCGIHDYMFGTMDFTSLKEIERSVEEALILWEPRIRDIDVEVILEEEDFGKLLVKIGYAVRTTNNPFNLVFPFYINEGFGDSV
ncbi:MAG: GPW/gp25 family protein [Hungatella sp.]|nr:GPW/gp25 family protein [Hungatella sp.]